MTRSVGLLLVPVVLMVACTADLSHISLGPVAPLTNDTLRLDVGETEVSVSWLVDGVEVEDLRDALEVGAGRTARGETWTAHLWARLDADRTREPDAVFESVIGNTAPTITSATLSPEAPLTTQDLRVQVVGADADDDDLTWRLEWYRDGEIVKGEVGEQVAAALTARGETWTARIWVSDGDLEVGPDEVSVMVANVAPQAQAVVLAPAQAFEDTELVATPTGTDDDGDTITWTFAWYVDGVEVDGQGTDRLDGAWFDKGQVVTVQATPSDAFVAGAPILSEGVLIGNTAPTASGATLQPAAPTEADTLSCIGEGFADIDGDPEGWQVAWTVDGVAAGTSVTLDGSAFDRDQVVRCTLVPFDGEAAGDAVVSPTVTVQNTAPALTSAAIGPAAPVTTETLSAVLGTATDIDGDEVTYAYAWTVDGAAAGTEATLPGSAFARDQVIGLTVTPTDGSDAGLPVLATPVTVQNSAPVISAVALSPSAPSTEDAVTASVTATDADDDGVTYTYTWSVDGVVVGGATSATLPASAFSKGEAVSVSVVASDGTDDSAAFISAAVTVVNTAPTLASASLSPSTVREGDTLTCEPAGFSDVDGDGASYTYAWTVDGTDPGVTTATLDGTSFGRGQSVVCTVTPGDGTDTGASVTTAAITIANTAPSVASVSLSSTTPRTEDDLVATAAGVTDADGDDIDLSWVWTVDGSTVRTFTGTALTDTLPASETAKGRVISVTITPADDADTGASVVSASATVANTAPVISAVTLSPSEVYTTTDLTASVSATDVDADTLSTTWVWKVNGTVVSETSSTLSASHFVKDDEVTVEASVTDGTDTTGPVASSAISVLNTAPVGGTATLTGTTWDDDLLCTVGATATDADGDALSYSISWQLDGVAWTGTVDTVTQTGDTIPSTETEWGDEWQCLVTVDDGDDTIDVASEVQGIIPVAPAIDRGTAATSSPYRGGSDAWTGSASDACASGEFLVGIQAEMQSGGIWVGAATRCAPLEVTCDVDDCIVETGTITTGPMRKGTNGASVATRDCPDGEVVTGFVGKSGSVTDQVSLRCRPITVSHDGTDWTAEIGTSFTDLSAMGGSGGGFYSRADCPAMPAAAAMQVNHYWNASAYVGLYLGCRLPEAVE